MRPPGLHGKCKFPGMIEIKVDFYSKHTYPARKYHQSSFCKRQTHDMVFQADRVHFYELGITYVTSFWVYVKRDKGSFCSAIRDLKFVSSKDIVPVRLEIIQLDARQSLLATSIKDTIWKAALRMAVTFGHKAIVVDTTVYEYFQLRITDVQTLLYIEWFPYILHQMLVSCIDNLLLCPRSLCPEGICPSQLPPTVATFMKCSLLDVPLRQMRRYVMDQSRWTELSTPLWPPVLMYSRISILHDTGVEVICLWVIKTDISNEFRTAGVTLFMSWVLIGDNVNSRNGNRTGNIII